ncbi:thyrotropin-releasing hormone receptor-like [Periplaneta americana]|uniref:thyrotropin-releasing hormone receptor-like n=1 Tax=Periplaneta americana TaxID=6978 RepID=UPI0037E700BF
MPTTIDHEVEPWRWRDLREFIIHQLSKGRVPSMENSTHHYDAIFIRGLRTHNMSLWNSTWPDIRPDYETTGPDVVPDECFPLLGLLDFFHLYYMPAIILIGLVGNLLSCVVFLNTHLKMRSSSYYLAALAVADFGFLATLLLVWLNSNVGVEVFNKDGWCQGLVYISSVCSFLSVWLIVAFTVERFIAVQYPLHRPHMCTVARAKAIVACLAVIALLSHLYSFVTAGLVRQDDGSDVCDMLEEYRETMRIINIVDSLVTLIAPLILIIVMNTMITRNLLKFSRRFKQNPDTLTVVDGMSMVRSDINLNQIHTSSSNNRRPPSQQSFHSSKSNNSRPIQARNNQTESVTPSRCIHVRSSSRNLVSTRTQQSITKMLLLISTVFILLNLPSYVIRLYVFVCFSLWHQQTPASLWCMQQFFMLLYYTNFSINFLLYSMCGITFRRCLWQLIRKKLKSLSRYHCNPQRYI